MWVGTGPKSWASRPIGVDPRGPSWTLVGPRGSVRGGDEEPTSDNCARDDSSSMKDPLQAKAFEDSCPLGVLLDRIQIFEIIFLSLHCSQIELPDQKTGEGPSEFFLLVLSSNVRFKKLDWRR